MQFAHNGGPAIGINDVDSLTVDGLGGSDTLRIQNPAGDVFAPTGGITYNGGTQGVGGSDVLENLGGTSASGTFTPGGTFGSGTVTHTTAAPVTQTISFTGLEPVIDTVAQTNFTINATAADDTVLLGDGTDPARLTVVPGAQESVEFANKTNVVVNAGDGADTIKATTTHSATGLARSS